MVEPATRIYVMILTNIVPYKNGAFLDTILDWPVGRTAIELKEAVPIFEKYGIQYYPEGERALRDVCSAAGISVDQVESELRKSETLSPSWLAREPDWEKETMAALIRYIIPVHHIKTCLLLDSIDRVLGRLVDRNLEPQRLGVVRDIFMNVNGELRHHMLEEETTIFPYLVYAERALAGKGASENLVKKGKSFADSMRNILFEHRFMDKGFLEMEKLVFLFWDDSGAKEMDPLVEALEELKKDNMKHIYLENNFLLKRAALLGLID